MKAELMIIKCITNLHMGNGDINFNIVDNEVERDPITTYPTMFSSGLKGALRNHFRELAADVNTIFGDTEKAGTVKFVTADILCQAVRASAGRRVYYLVTCPIALRRYLENRIRFCKDEEAIQALTELDNLKLFDSKTNKEQVYIFKKCETEMVGVDGYNYSAENTQDLEDAAGTLCKMMKSILGEDMKKLVVISSKRMSELRLPVVARNCLDDNGKSKNLWYEELVPHNSIFFCPVLSMDEVALDEFKRTIQKNNIVQFGGNASIGEGLAELSFC